LGMDVYVLDETVVERATVFNVRPEDDGCATPPRPLVSHAIYGALLLGCNLVAFLRAGRPHTISFWFRRPSNIRSGYSQLVHHRF